MSDFFNDDPEEPRRPVPIRHDSRRPRPLVLTIVVMAVLLIGFSLFAGIWTDRLWFGSIGYSKVFSTLLWTKIGMFVVFGAAMGLVVGGNLWIAFRLRPTFRANSAEQANLDRYREVITPIRRALLISVSLVFALFAGGSASGKWRIFLLWEHRQSFGQTDTYFHKDIGFYVFTLPWLHYLVDFAITAMVIGLLAALAVHYVYGGIRLQARVGKVSGPAQAQMSVLLGVLVLLKAADYYLDRFDLTSQSGPLITGMTYSRDHAMLPSKNILMAIAAICALLFFANVFRRTWMLPAVGLALFALSAVLLGMLWPALVQRFQVKPDEPDKEASYIKHNIAATRAAYDLDATAVTPYTAKTSLDASQLSADAASLPGIRLLDPSLVSSTFDQLQQVRGYYNVPAVLDVDRYQVDGQERDMVVAARELHLEGLPDGQKKWANEHTVYTHGYGMIAAYGNQRDSAGNFVQSEDGQPAWAEKDLPPEGVLTDANKPDGYRPQIYFGENSPSYSIVGRAAGGRNVELDVPQGSGTPGQSKTSTYAGKDGVGVGSMFRKALYAVKFGEPNFLLSSRVHADSKVLYNRSPRERLQKVAPWLTVDNDALPAVVNGKIVWILDGYTTTDRYPLSEKKSFQEMTSDAINPRTAYATLPTDQINYMRNAVKATVDAYDGTVTLYAWDDSDPILKAWEGAFPGVVKPRSDIPPDLLAHFRYPEDMFKVQRSLLAAYHVLDPRTFYEGNDQWDIPEDPNLPTRKQPAYRLSVATQTGEKPVFSLTSVFVPAKKQNLSAFVAVGADAADPSTYGKFQILRLPDTNQVAGPSQIASKFSSDPAVAAAVRNFKQNDAKVEYGNLLTLPVGGGLLYVQPLYTVRQAGAGNYPTLQYVLVSFGDKVGIGPDLTSALKVVLGAAPPVVTPTEPGSGTGGTTELPTGAVVLLQQADDKFREAETALKAGDLQTYATKIEEARRLVEQALEAGKKKP
ncbi:UPF0182 family protein [Nocardioides pocheonensis]|uniref:UPF0182 protein EFL26_09010 n=1 Tax=Nocardioides pocheonensis TaxID=661485 RepID=A0A3N0GSM5_9ACTN|nr:UPF0182 family protein [Nocardioides pocheonensis]RNM15122.1 UPF0182 family protein [Nocardioides pocheonensis]